MLSEFLRRRRAVAWQSLGVDDATKLELDRIADSYFNHTCLSGFSKQWKRETRDDLNKQITAIMTGKNRFKDLREQIGDNAFAYASRQVLCLKESEKAAPATDGPYISGQLHYKVLECAEFDENLKRLPRKSNDPEELIALCKVQCTVCLLYLNSLNVLRVRFGDYDSSWDWFQPFIHSMLIFAEDSCRGNLKMPSLLPGPLHGIAHGTFSSFVVNGDPNPFLKWRSQTQDMFA